MVNRREFLGAGLAAASIAQAMPQDRMRMP
jgi:hypothetical protein